MYLDIMERRIAKKVDTHQVEFKSDIKTWLNERNARVVSPSGEDLTSSFLLYIYDRSNLCLSKEDFMRRRRVKNVVPVYERCTALRACGEQCTRRKKDGSDYCGTHVKGTPHGAIAEGSGGPAIHSRSVEVTLIDVKGIQYYVDDDQNVYLPEDIIQSVPNPRKIGSWITGPDGLPAIPELCA